MSTTVEDLGIFRHSVSSSFLSRFLAQESVQTPSFNPPFHNPPSLPSLPVLSPNPTMIPVVFSQFPHPPLCPDPSPEPESESEPDPRRVARSVVAGFLLDYRGDLSSDYVSSRDIAADLYRTGKISPIEEEYLLRLTSPTSAPLSEHHLEPLITAINGALLEIEADTKAVTTGGMVYMNGKPRVHVLAVNRVSLAHELLPLSLPFHHLSLGHFPSEDEIERRKQEIMKIVEEVDKLEVYQFPGLRGRTARV